MKLAEIFSSIQGEGLYVGVRQIFVRFPKCNIVCAYCDEDDLAYSEWSTPAILKKIGEFVAAVPHHSVSFTGGEPCLYAHHILELAPQIPLPLFLETNGTLPEKMASLLPYLSFVSLDYKPGHEDTFEQSLELVRHSNSYIKWVLCPDSSENELERMAAIVKRVVPRIPVFFQPVTPCRDVHETISPERILALTDLALRLGLSVRVVPQTHKQIGLP